jgi:hypothetical protein
MALMCRLTKLKLMSIAKAFNVHDHSTVIHARNAMSPSLDATRLTTDDSVQMWVEAALPILFVQIAELRRRNRAHAAHTVSNKGKPPEHDPNRGSVGQECGYKELHIGRDQRQLKVAPWTF